MKKSGVLFYLVLFTVMFSSLAFAAINPNMTVDQKAYDCIESRVLGKCSTLGFEDQVFALLAMASNQNIADECKSALDSSRECWPAEGCKIRDTAVAMLALSQTGADVSSAKDWLTSKEKTPDKLLWHLQIDTSTNATCKVSFGSQEYTVKIGNDKKLTIPANQCLKPAVYWLTIEKSCFGETFTVTCDVDFVSSLLYKTTTSNTFFISSTPSQSSGGGLTEHQPSSKCFGDTGCDYASTLWASFALLKTKNDIKSYLPYLFSAAEENEKLSPYSFLYIFTAEDEYRQKMINEQKPEGFWDFGSGKGKFFDTAVAMLAFQTKAEYSDVLDVVSSYLSSPRIQGQDGCWQNSIRDTSFLAWSLWPKLVQISPTQQNCENSGLYCMAEGECSVSGGNIKENYYCPGLRACCDKPILLKSCEEQLGLICPTGEVCSAGFVAASDTDSCCLAQCGPETTENECELANNFCRATCFDDEDEAIEYSCNPGDVCCMTKMEEEGGSGFLWIIIIILLIALVVVAILFRQKIQIWWAKTRTKKTLPPPGATAMKKQAYPLYSSSAVHPRTATTAAKPVAQARPAAPARPVSQPAAKKPAGANKELEETLRKLKEMSKG